MGREEYYEQISPACVGCAHSVWAALGLPRSRRVSFPSLHCPGSRLLCRELSDAGPGLHALPRSKPLGFRFSGTTRRRRLGWACLFCPSQVQAAWVTRSSARIVAPSWRLWLLPSLVPAFRFSGCTAVAPSSGKLISGCDPPGGWQMSTVQNPKKSWLATKSACALV